MSAPTKAPAPTPPAEPEGPPTATEARVAHITHSAVQSSPGELVQDIVLQMIDEGVKFVTGAESPEDGWSQLFASDDVVAIKVNTISRTVYTHPVVAYAIAQRLLDVGVYPANIIIWDRTRGELQSDGYELQDSSNAVRIRAVGGDWEERPTRQGSFNGRLAKILTQECSALINVPVLKNHGGAVVTLAMKNHYGSHDNPGNHHGNQCDPYIADLNSIDVIKDKTRLIICDATRACANGGPGARDPRYVWSPNAVLVATDPVAHDTYGTKLIDEKRRSLGLGGIDPPQLASAAARGLGTNDLGKIDVRNINLA